MARGSRGIEGASLALGVLALVLMSGVFALDLLTPPEVAAGTLYAIVIFYAWLMRATAMVIGIAVACTLLTLGEVFVGEAGARDVVGINKLISIVTIWVSTTLVLLVRWSVQHVEDARRRIEAESAKLERALEHAPSAMLMVDDAGRVLLVNRQAERLCGYPRRLLVGEPVDLLVPERARAAHGRWWARFLAEPRARPMGAFRAQPLRRRDGEEVPVDVAFNPIDTPDGLRVMISLADARARQVAEAHRHEAERLARELELAARIQTSLLPRPPLAPGLELAARMIPAAEVGGDYYDVVPAADGCWIAIGDVSGHGLDAGLVSMMAQSATAAILRTTPEITPADALAGINAVLHDNVRARLARDDFVTFNLLRYRRDGAIAHCGAHEDILVWRAATRTVERHPTGGMWLALDAGARFQARELRLCDGDVMVLLSDGLIENRNAAGEVLGIEAAVRLLAERGELGAAELVEALVEASLGWASPPEDDLTVVVLRHRDPAAAAAATAAAAG